MTKEHTQQSHSHEKNVGETPTTEEAIEGKEENKNQCEGKTEKADRAESQP